MRLIFTGSCGIASHNHEGIRRPSPVIFYFLSEITLSEVLVLEVKYCSTCKHEVSIDQFEIKKGGTLLKTCNRCREINKLYKSTHEPAPRKPSPPKPPKPPRWGTKAYWEQHPEIKTRTCTRCGKIRPETEEYFYFYQRENRFQVLCKQCSDMRKRAKNKRNLKPEVKEKQAEYRRKYYEANKEELNRKNREHHRQYYKENHEAILERKRELRLLNIDTVKQKRKEYMQSPKGRELKARGRRTWKQNRRAREKGLEASLTAKQWEECKSFFNGCCAYCGKEADMTMDHFIAVANCGEYSRDNILPVCCDCNSSKRDIDFFIWYPAQPFYSKLREKKLLRYLNYKGEGVQQRTLFG